MNVENMNIHLLRNFDNMDTLLEVNMDLHQDANHPSTQISLEQFKEWSLHPSSKGYKETWTGGKLHISAVDGDIPITAIYTGANVHDSSVALPLIKETSRKVSYLFDLLDAGYDADIIREYSWLHGHRPIIDINPKNSKELKAKIALIREEKEKFKFFNLPLSLDIHHYNQRSMVERVNAYLKDNFGCNEIYYQGATKVASVLQFAILSVCIHQSLKLVT